MSWKLNAGAQVCVVSVCLQIPVLGLSPTCSVPGCRGPMDAEDGCCWAWLGQAVLNCGQGQAERKHKSSFGDYHSNSNGMKYLVI